MIPAPPYMTRAGPGARLRVAGGLVAMATVRPFRLSRWFLFLWLPWFTLGAIAWGGLATGHSTRGRP
jgi:hypothetical protein